MTTTVLARPKHYVGGGGTAKVLLVPTGGIADLDAPTALELNAAGTIEVSAQLTGGKTGWTTEPQFTTFRTTGSAYELKKRNYIVLPDSSLTFHPDEETDDIRASVNVGDEYVLVFADAGWGDTKTGNIFPAQVASISPPLSLDDTQPEIVVMFNLTADPHFAVPLPSGYPS